MSEPFLHYVYGTAKNISLPNNQANRFFRETSRQINHAWQYEHQQARGERSRGPKAGQRFLSCRYDPARTETISFLLKTSTRAASSDCKLLVMQQERWGLRGPHLGWKSISFQVRRPKAEMVGRLESSNSPSSQRPAPSQRPVPGRQMRDATFIPYSDEKWQTNEGLLHPIPRLVDLRRALWWKYQSELDHPGGLLLHHPCPGIFGARLEKQSSSNNRLILYTLLGSSRPELGGGFPNHF